MAQTQCLPQKLLRYLCRGCGIHWPQLCLASFKWDPNFLLICQTTKVFLLTTKFIEIMLRSFKINIIVQTRITELDTLVCSKGRNYMYHQNYQIYIHVSREIALLHVLFSCCFKFFKALLKELFLKKNMTTLHWHEATDRYCSHCHPTKRYEILLK